jgi:hypothetical protein
MTRDQRLEKMDRLGRALRLFDGIREEIGTEFPGADKCLDDIDDDMDRCVAKITAAHDKMAADLDAEIAAVEATFPRAAE